MVKKEKIIELKIEEDDELSGIDSISLVDEPAIEVNWMFFNKTQEDFHIPDGEDEKYLSLIIEKGQPEQELLNEGWVVDSIRYVGETKFFSTSPNEPSAQDTEDYLVRYKYILNPNISQSAIIPTTRQFCRTILNQNRVWRIEDMDMTFNEFGQPATLWRGGYNCRHRWAEIKYKRDTTIINKASVKRGVESESVPPQPSTVTDKTKKAVSKGTAAPSTAKNLGLSKTNFEVGLPHYTKDGKLYEGPTHKDASGRLMTGAVHTEDSEYLYHIDELGYENGLPSYVDEVSGDTISKSLVEPTTFESYNDYPEAAKNNACKVLRWRDEHGDEVKGMTQVGWTRANQLCKGENISEETIARMASFARHRENAEVAEEYKSTPWKDKGYVAWLGWGGTTGIEWAQNKLESIRNNMSKQHFQIDNEEKRIVLGPAMIPDQKIFRKDALGNPYYVFFSPETIKMIAEKYMKNQYTRNNDLMHDGQAVQDIYVVESWIKEDDHDKSNKYGYEDLPVGTWFVSMKIPKTKKGDEVWNQVKSGKLNGFSVSGFFEEVEAFTKEEMFLYKVSEILSNIKDDE